MPDEDWEIRIRGRGPVFNNDSGDANAIGKVALTALITAGHTIRNKQIKTESRKSLSD